MADSESRPEWQKQLAGGFCHMTAPFAVHPLDKDRAKLSVKLAKEAGVTQAEYVAAARKYLETAQGWPTDIEDQLARVRKFIAKKLDN